MTILAIPVLAAVMTLVMFMGAVWLFWNVPAKEPVNVPRDPRAYEVSSRAISLEEGLRRAGVRLPRCLGDDFNYALINDGFGYYYKIYIQLVSSERCVNDLLLDNGMKDTFGNAQLIGPEAQGKLSHRLMWMDEYPVPQMGWNVGPEQRFHRFWGRGTTYYTIELLVQYRSEDQAIQAYLYAFRGG